MLAESMKLETVYFLLSYYYEQGEPMSGYMITKITKDREEAEEHAKGVGDLSRENQYREIKVYETSTGEYVSTRLKFIRTGDFNNKF